MASRTAQPMGTIETALAHARRLLGSRPDLAVEQAQEILRAVPRHPAASALLGEAWRTVGDQLHLAGDEPGGDAAHLNALRASITDPILLEAADALARNDLPPAEQLLRDRLRTQPTDIAAIRMLAELAGRIGRYRDAENLLRRALELAPNFRAARHNLALALHRQTRSVEAIAEIDGLLGEEPGNPSYLNLKAAALSRLGDYAPAIALYERVVAAHPNQPKVWMSLGHALKTVGRRDDSVAAYRKSLELMPTLGETYWSLANLKTYRFSDAEMAAMLGAIQRPDLSEEDRFHLEFALGKAEEDAGAYAASFAHYAEGNRRRRLTIDYSADDLHAEVERKRALYTAGFFSERAGWGCSAADPIFIVSLPRSGSTLIEQILASHSQVEGTMELPDMPALANRAGSAGIATLTQDQVRALGEEYLDRTRIQRKTDRPFFIDKLPNNWAHVGLIRLILPNATIIDARRHPIGCCLSNFKQHFAHGQAFTYDLAEIGRYYADYAALMRHFDAILPGHVHRVFYEAMVDDTEHEVRALLAHAGLDFEPACLRFHETERAVRTASSEQVRQPIFRDGVEQWRHFAPWLAPLAQAVRGELERYPYAS
jgi:tetratricopeptide (TPR) repeat protein